MKRVSLLLAVSLANSPLLGSPRCIPRETVSIIAQARCVNDGGISIGPDAEDRGAKVACMLDPKVKGLCGADGRLTRLKAYRLWFNTIKKFEDQCAATGGTFNYEDADFHEPQNESFCGLAVPEISTNMFEEPLCNYRSVCPSVSVVCERACAE